MIVYIPTPITSAEQAESLPEGTIAISEEFAPEVFVKDEDSWTGTHGPGAFTNESAVGLEALVPIEAKEEQTWISSSIAGPMHVGFGAAFDTPHARLATPWQPSPNRRGDCA